MALANNAEETLLADELIGDGDAGLAQVAEAVLLHDGEELGPARLGLLVERDAVQPVLLRVAGAVRDGVAAGVEVVEALVGREVGQRGAAAGAGRLEIRVFGERGRRLELEVGVGDAREGGGGQEDGLGEGSHFLSLGWCCDCGELFVCLCMYRGLAVGESCNLRLNKVC